MRKVICFLACVIVLSACGTTNNPEENSNAVYPSEAETSDRDFIYRLFTEKDVYEEFGDIAIYAELTYVGEKESIEIYHAASPFYFPIEERTRGFQIDYPMEEPLLTTTLIKGEALRQNYTFAGGYSDMDDPDYVEFVKTLVNKGFPEGRYIINGSAQFSILDPSEATENETFNMNVNIGFSVNKGINK